MLPNLQQRWKKKVLDSIERADVRYDRDEQVLILQLHVLPMTIENGLPKNGIMDDFLVVLHHENGNERLKCQADWIDTEGSMFTARLRPMNGESIELFVADSPVHSLTLVEASVLGFGDSLRREFPNRRSRAAFHRPPKGDQI